MPELFWRRHEQDPIERVKSGLPLSPNEERYVLTEAMAPSPIGNPWMVRIKGALDPVRFEAAIRQACDRHEARRTGFEPSGDGRFTRYVEARTRPYFEWRDMIGASPAELRAAVRRWFMDRPRDLGPPTFTRFMIVRLAPDEHAFVNSFHHATSDGETHRWILKEIFDCYAGTPPQGEPPQYSEVWDFDWRDTDAYRAAEAFWRETLGGVEEVGELPEDGGDPPGAEWDGPVQHRLPPELVAAAKRAADQAGVSEFTFHYAASLVLLTRLTGRPRVCSTFQSGGRRHVAGSDGVHGVFSNGLILATEVDERQSVAELAQQLRGEIRAALAHEVYPYHHVIRATGLSPHFGINWFPELLELEAPGLEISRPEMSFGRYEYDLNLRFIRDAETGAIDLVIFFREDAYRRSRVIAVAEQYAALLGRLATDVTAPIAAARSADLAPAGVLPDPTAPLPAGGGELIHAAFLRQARQAPEAPAIVHDGRTYACGEVEHRSRVLAGQLLAAGVAPGDRVAFVAERRPELVWSMLAAARIGAPFVVLDSAYPEARLAELAQISAPVAIVPAGGPDAESLARRLAGRLGIGLVEPSEGEPADPARLDRAEPTAPAYFLFTSGSTGRPKGVACSHVPLSRFTAWQAETFGLTADDRFSMLAGLSHDPLLRDVFTPLSLGACIAVPDAATVTEPGALALWFRKTGVTVAHMTPALGRVLLAGVARARGLPALRRVFWGGDQLPPELTAELAAAAPGAQQANFYGATETPQAVGVFRCEGEMGRRAVPVGQGANGAQLLVVDAERRPVGIGEAGEIAVRSNYLSLGYVEAGRVAPPADRGRDAQGEANIYFTGDRGFYLPSGDVQVLGRTDDQVKIRGHRVELAEITGALKARTEVGEAITLAVGEGQNVRIAAFVTPARRGPTPNEQELMTALGARLPAHMLPRTIEILDRLPLLPNGKVDRKTLQERSEASALPTQAVAGAAGANDVERELIARWSGVLGEVGVTRTTSFAGLGGDSLSYVQAYLATEEVIGVVPTGWQNMSVADLAAAKRRASRFWSVVDTPMLVRALSILMVVLGHMQLVSYGGGATAGLMIVAGFLMGTFQISEAFAGGTAAPILKGLRRVFVPTILFSMLLFAVKSYAGKDPSLSVLFLTGNFQDYSKLSSPRWGGHEFYLWFIYCMIQMMALIYLSALAVFRLAGSKVDAKRFVLGMFLVGCFTRFVAPAAFVPAFFTQGAPSLTMLSFLPTTHLPTLMLGALVAMAATPRERLGVLGLLAAYTALTAHLYSGQHALVILGAGLLISTFRRVILPKPLTLLVLTLSGASLFIYLTHFQFRGLLRALGAPDLPALHAAAGLVGGVVVWALWVWGSALVARLLHRTPTPQPEPAI